jgi:hypothetical protein
MFALCTSSAVASAQQPVLLPDSLVISSTTYDRSEGAVASLNVGTALAGSASATTTAIAGNDYVNVWNNGSVDASFGVTSAIHLTDIEPHSGHVFQTLSVPVDQVVTSFPSKSELGLHITKDSSYFHLVFVGYAGAGVGAIDVSNSDAVAGQDPTNPVTFAFGSNHAFARTIVSMDARGHFSYTPTTDYGGNNGRSALLGSNGLYYAVGNAWQLDYVLTGGLIGSVDGPLDGADGQYPAVTTIGLRNLTGVVHGNSATLWAATSTSSASGDNGADPNKVVEIMDQLGATTMTSTVAHESFRVVAGPTYGTVYRGVAYVQ